MILNKSILASILATLLSFSASAAVLCVDATSTDPTPPYSSMAKAAVTIQDAIGVATAGDTILVTNGVYGTGAYDYYGASRVAMTNAVTVRSVNGPAVTTIQGEQVAGTTNGTGAVRCAFVGTGSTLSGFTLTGGATANSGLYTSGGGVYCQSASAMVSNCTFTANSAFSGGAGAYKGTVDNCSFAGNVTPGIGAGANGSLLRNCLVLGNVAANGGGVGSGGIINCTVCSNSASVQGGGTFNTEHYNSIIYYNSAPTNPDAHDPLSHPARVNCCTTGGGAYTGNNFTNEPLFVAPAAGNFRLQANSPCINAGTSACMTNNLDFGGLGRISGGTVDVGAYEVQNPASMLSYVWAQYYNFRTDGTADGDDPDQDGHSNYQEWVAGTIPTDDLSVLRLWTPTADASGVFLRWNSVYLKKYYIQRSTNLSAQPAFISIGSSITGQSGTTTRRDHEATNAGPYFYRVGVQ